MPFAIEGRPRLGATAFGQALLSLLRFAWSNGTRRELFAFLRTPYGGLARPDVDFLEGRLRGRAVLRGDRTIEETTKLRTGRPLPILELIAAEGEPLGRGRAAVARDAAQRLRPRRAARDDAREARSPGSGRCRAGSSTSWSDSARPAWPVRADDILTALDRATVRGDAAGEPGRVAVLDLARARTRRFEAVFVIGLEQGSLPRRAPTSPFFDDETRRELDGARGARLQRPDAASRDRYLFYTACTRPRRLLTLVREAATDDGSPREASPFWEAVCELFDRDDVRRHTTRRPLARLTWPIESAPTERERLRALARLAAVDPREADALAYANGWQRKLGRAQAGVRAPDGDTPSPSTWRCSTSRETFRVTDLERMAGCSSAWFIERYLRPGEIDQVVGPKMRGSIAHVALQRFYSQLPAAIPGAERVTPENVEAAVELMHQCVDGALDSGLRIDVDDLQRRELGQGLRRDLEQLVRADAAASSTFVPRKLEVAFKAIRARARCRGQRQDRPRRRRSVERPRDHRRLQVRAAPSATQIHDEARLQIPLYLLVLRDQLGLEPMGGVYMPLGGGRRARGMLRGGDDQVPGFAAADYLDGAGVRAEIDHARDCRRGARRSGSGQATSPTIPMAATARPGAISGGCAARSAHERRSRVPNAAAAGAPSTPAARPSSPPVPAPARRPCSSSGSPARSSTTASTSTRCS